MDPGPVRCMDLWFEDGTVVIQAETTLFRVYRGMLAAHSPVFRDMFAIPQPAAAETVEGCPLVVLYDAAEDVRYLLRVMFEPGYYDANYTTDLCLLSAALRLSTKYDASAIRQRILSELSLLFPTSLIDWRKRELQPLHRAFEGKGALVVYLARVCHAPTLLPGAMYSLCNIPTRALFNDLRTHDGKLLAELTLEEKQYAILGREDIMAQCRNLLAPLKILRVRNCTNCKGASSDWLFNLESSKQDKGYDWLDVFGPGSYAFGSYFCPPCTALMTDAAEVLQFQLWNDLPDYFGLPRWEVLKSADSS